MGEQHETALLIRFPHYWGLGGRFRTYARGLLIEINLAFTNALRKQRETSGLPQAELAGKIGSSQSRVAKMEAGDPHVSLDLMIRALLAAGMTRTELADVIAGRRPEEAAPVSRTGTGRRNAPKKRVQKPAAQAAVV